MEQFKHLKLPTLKKASDSKTVVKPAATKFKSTWSKLSNLDKLVLYGVALWILIMVLMFTTATESDSIDIEYYDDISMELERLA